MTPLRELQARFGAALIDRSAGALAALIAPDRLAPQQRFQIYANHVRISLIEALGSNFPVVRRLVGEEFFRWAAARYITDAPPCRPCLFEYGDGLPDFLDRLEACQELPYLGDVARFEWAINLACHAPDTPILRPDALAALAAEDIPHLRLVFHPSCHLIASPWPVTAIWRANQAGEERSGPIDLDRGGVRLLVQRHNLNVVWRELDAAEHVFLASLHAGQSLDCAWQQAASAASASDAFDLPGVLTRLLTGHCLAGISLAPLLSNLKETSP